MSPKVAQHSLRSLVEKGLGPLSVPECDLLDALTSSVRWRGRYPVPRSAAEWADSNRLRLISADREVASQVFHRLTRAVTRGVAFPDA